MDESKDSDKDHSNFLNDLGHINGICVTKKFHNIANLVKNWTVRDEDVWICSFPKSGTTWTQEMVWLIMNNLNFEKAKEDLESRSPFFEFSGIFEPIWQDEDIPLFLVNSFDYLKKMSKDGPVCIKTHLPWAVLPTEIQENRKTPKIIYVSRDPRDIVVSFYHHQLLLSDYKGSLDDFCKSFIQDEVIWGPYWQNVLPFWERRHQPNILFLRYEEMLKDLRGVIKKTAKFLEKPLTDNEVDILCDYLSFSKMKNNPAVNKEAYIKYFTELDNPSFSFLRNGQTGSHKNEMSPEFIEKCNLWIRKNIAGSDYVIY